MNRIFKISIVFFFVVFVFAFGFFLGRSSHIALDTAADANTCMVVLNCIQEGSVDSAVNILKRHLQVNVSMLKAIGFWGAFGLPNERRNHILDAYEKFHDEQETYTSQTESQSL
ncbi:MAG: hypothetical protein P9M03_09985 [Candidatus Theseobacter exili]|nr:hypothetical protein [Candidatus Theseobacter exili]